VFDEVGLLGFYSAFRSFETFGYSSLLVVEAFGGLTPAAIYAYYCSS